MNKEAINKQIETLMTQGKQLEVQLHMINGALQDCNYWLAELDKQVEVASDGQND
jgi:hypothetical protein